MARSKAAAEFQDSGSESEFAELEGIRVCKESSEEFLFSDSRQKFSSSDGQCDNQGISQQAGRDKILSLDRITDRIFIWAQRTVLSLRAIRIQGTDNSLADTLSQEIPSSVHFCLHSCVFKLIFRWGLPVIICSRLRRT